jgi:hypothetical protein
LQQRHTGNIAKENATELNEELWLIAGKIMVVHVAIAGDLAFFATILGKENMSSV